MPTPIVRVGDHVELHPSTDRWMRGDKFGTVTSATKAGVGVKFDRSGQTKRIAPSRIGRLNGVFVDGVAIPSPKRASRKRVANPGRKTAERSGKRSTLVLTARDLEHVRETARILIAEQNDDTYEGSEVIMTSRGYVEVDVIRGEEDTAYVITTQHGMVAVPMNPHRRGRSSLAAKRHSNPPKRKSSLDSFCNAYIEAALFSSTDDDGDPLDRNYSDSDIAGPTLLKMKRDCAKFQRENARDLESGSSSQGGHDFWLTRCGHGAGYWDGDWPEPEATRLTDAAHKFGNVDLYIGDDGKIHASNAYKRAVGRKSKAGRKTATRRKVSSRKVANPPKRKLPAAKRRR